MKVTQIVKINTPLGIKVRKYVKWKYRGKRVLNMALVMSDGTIKLFTSLWGKRADSALTEFVSPYIMNAEIKQNKL